MKVYLIVVFLAVTVYMAVAAFEDYKTCQVTRWKHLMGFIPTMILLMINPFKISYVDYIFIIIFCLLLIFAGSVGVYGLADGFVLTNLTLLFGGIGGTEGIFIVILIMVMASASMLVCHIGYSIVKRKKVFKNVASAFVPHLFLGYVVTMVLI